MNPKHGESVRDPDTGELLVWRTLPAGSRRARSNITIVRGVHSGELRMLCTLLRDNRPLAPEVREAVAAMLEKLFWNEPSGASEYTEKTRTLRAWLMRAYIEARVAEMKQAGERP